MIATLSYKVWPARVFGPAILCSALLLTAMPARAAAADDHQQALAALADVRAAIGEIVGADASYSTDKVSYRTSAQRAIDALVGAGDAAFSGHPASGADRIGALGHIDRLLDRVATPAWADALRGADANLRGAVGKLTTAQGARELMDFQIAASQALADLEVARGRASDTGVLGGLEGALANTVLGVPDGATQFDACAAPGEVPAFGVHDGWLAVIALPAAEGIHMLDEDYGIRDVTVQGSTLLLHTAAQKLVAAQCGAKQHVAAAPAPSGTASTESPQPAASATSSPPAASATSSPPPALYTQAQAEAGKSLFMAHCAVCHGAKLNGVSAPSVAGTDFLSTAKKNSWTLKIIRYIVVEMMPLNASGTLSPTEYSQLMAFLLASNCYPTGSTPFPTEAKPEFDTIQLQPLPGAHPNASPAGVCPVN